MIYSGGHFQTAAREPIQISVAFRSAQPGELAIVTVTGDGPIDHVHVRAFDRDIPTFSEDASSWRALVGIDLDTVPQTYPVAVDADVQGNAVHAIHELVVQPKQFATRNLKVDPTFVNPPAAVARRIEEETDLLNRVYRASAGQRLWSGEFVRPVAGLAVSRFGTRSVFNGEPRNPHGGADFMSPTGTPIKAPNAGRIVLARPMYFSGNTVVIDHGLGLFSTLAHLSAFSMHEGDDVKSGQVVGRVGATGRVTGAHLHWAVRANDARIDPLSLLALLGRKK